MSRLKIVKIEDGDPFEEHPILKTIWPSPYRDIAQEAASEDLVAMAAGEPLGALFLALVDGVPSGISGYFPMSGDGSIIGLRWHGLAAEHRGQGLSREMLGMVLEHAAKDFPDAAELVELAPANEYGKPIARHFLRLGFVAVGEEERYDWSDNAWQPYHLNIARFMAERARPQSSRGPRP